MIDTSRPFVLIDDARDTGAGPARLFRGPVATVSAREPGEVAAAFEALRAGRRRGHHAAGYVGYEAGLALEPRLKSLARPAPASAAPLLWFGLFEAMDMIAPVDVPALLPDPAGAWAGTPRPAVDRQDHARAVADILALIAAGDIYQANLTFQSSVAVLGDPLALYARLRPAMRGGWGGVVHDGERWLLSFSPELFFTLRAGRITARPMKGTAAATAEPGELAGDPKQRAENLMIVDLIRNDLARVAEPGSVAVPALFEVEHYPMVQQMTSTVTARIEAGRDAVDVLGAIFPCGSVTGAPKIRAMEVIAAVEARPRGPYTGSIGWLAPDGEAAFNVAIRTLILERGKRDAAIGLGSAIVADSLADAEWRECLAKGAFVTAAGRPFDLIETMRFDARDGVIDLERHLGRMKASAETLEFRFDRHDVRNELQAATFRLREAHRVRLRLSRTGAVAIEVRPLPATPATMTVALVARPVPASDFRLVHKTSDRGFYDEARRAAGTDEVVFVDERGLVGEGSFTSVFVERDGGLVTPRGGAMLPGILRQRLIEEGRAIEGNVRPEELARGFFVGNALRGLIAARLVAAGGGAGL